MSRKSLPPNFPEIMKVKAEEVKKIVEEQAPMRCIQKANIINNHFHIHMDKKLLNLKEEKEEKEEKNDSDTDSVSSFDSSDSESEVEVKKLARPSSSKKSTQKKN